MTHSNPTLREVRKSCGLSVADLAKKANICKAAIYSIENGKRKYRIHNGVAVALAAALGLNQNEIDWGTDLSHLGRPDGTGKTITFNRTHTIMVTEEVTIASNESLCPEHFIVLPANGVRDCCL